MNIENRLSDLLREAATEPGVEPTQSKWLAVLRRASAAKRSRRRQGLLIAGLSTAAVIAVVVGVFLANDRDRTGPVTREPEAAAAPAHLVVAEPGRLLVRSSATGEVLRVLVEGEDAEQITSVAVSPDGSQVFFHKAGTRCPNGAARSEVVRMPISGGPLEHVVWGTGPVLDATGEFLSFVGDNESGCGDREVAYQVALSTGAITTLADSEGAPSVTPRSSSPGGHLTLGDDAGGEIPQVIMDAGEGRDRVTLHPVVFPSHVVAGRAIAFVGERLVAATYALEGDDYIATFDPLDGSDATELFKLGADEITAYPDATGENFIVPTVDGETNGVRRWSRDDGFVRVGDFEANGPLTWARGPGVAPKHFVALTLSGELQIRETTSGDVVRELRDDIDTSHGVPRLAVSPDGRYVYVDRHDVRDCEDNPGGKGMSIARVSIASGEVEEVVDGRDPALSADGTKLAYVTGPCGTEAELVVRDLASRAEERWQANPDDDSWSVEEPYWSPDSRMIAVTLHSDETDSVRLLDTLESDGPSLTDAHAISLAEPEPGRAVFGYLTEDEILAIETPEDASHIVALDPVSGERKRLIHIVPGIRANVGIETSADGGHVLFVTRNAYVGGGGSEPSFVEYMSIGALEHRELADDLLTAAWLERLPSATD